MSSRLWSLGVLLVALGVAAHAVGWDALLWLPMWLADSLLWVPMALADAVRTAPATVAVIAAGVLLMVLSRFVGRRRDDDRDPRRNT